MALSFPIREFQRDTSGDLTLLIDADKFCYSCGYPTDDEPVANALHLVDISIEKILSALPHKDHQVFIGGRDNFRERLATLQPYKGNRTREKPVHYQAIRQHLVDKWKAEVIDGMETDDWVSYLCYQHPDETCIVSGDKDLLNTPGYHANPDKLDLGIFEVTDEEATHNFYYQLLVGDKVDNIRGLTKVPLQYIESYDLHHSAKKGCGDKSARILLEGCATEWEYYSRVRGLYIDLAEQECEEGCDCYEAALAELLENGRLLWMTREINEDGTPVLWSFPEEPTDLDTDSSNA